MNKFFINKQNGIKQSVIIKWFLIIISVGVFFTFEVGDVHAANQTYTQQFQNSTTTLSGQSVESNMYFTKMEYWNVKNATFNLNYQVSQLSSKQTSDITVSINGVKFYSFRPSNKSGFQTEQIKIPVSLLSGDNTLKITGQILTKKGKGNYQLAQTPANWLTIKSGSNVNFEYQLKDADNTVASFYGHFVGQDTIANQESKIVTPNNASSDELTAAMITLAGEARVITTANEQIPVVKYSDMNAQSGNYIMAVMTYNHLPNNLKNKIDQSKLKNNALVMTQYQNGKHYLVVTAKNGKLLKKAARFVANQELMNETNQSAETITSSTDTDSSSLHDNEKYKLTSSPDVVTGSGHRTTTYQISLPNDRSNADGSKVKLHFKYSKNMDFKNSLVTVYVNNTTLGSKKLTKSHADGDELTVDVPRGTALGNSFTVQVAFDLETNGNDNSDNSNTPWAQVEPSSRMIVKSERSNDLLYTNYPTLFIKHQTYNNIAVVLPKRLSSVDYQTLTNVFNLIGSFAKSNTGNIQFYTHKPSNKVLANSNVIVIGTPKSNKMIKDLNKDLYFKFSKNLTRIVSNEKLSIEKNYGTQVGTAQLLRSPYNKRRGMLVVTGASNQAAYLASTQINFQKNIEQYSGDAIVVDQNNNHYGYRFKKDKAINESLVKKRFFDSNSQIILYLGLIVLALVALCAVVILILKKQSLLNGGHKHEK
ncbi:cellulose biosynthesis cyclic di-GMP-binding regulatory protein BcsB [Paucilactobacillus suebicus]